MTQEALKAILQSARETAGESLFWRTIEQMKRVKVNPKREEKKGFPWWMVSGAYNRQNGVCPWCEKDMVKKRGLIDGDHINPNLEERLNAPENCQALHHQCNLEKGSMSVAEQAKHLGKTMREIIDVETNDGSILHKPDES